MFSAFVGIAYWERPTLLVTADYTPAELAAQNAKYQDYIASFQNGEGGKWQEAPKKAGVQNPGNAAPGSQPRMNDAAKGRLDKYIDDCSLAGLKTVRIVHGKGTGALRSAVTGKLSVDPRVKEFRQGDPAEGGDGVTIAKLV